MTAAHLPKSTTLSAIEAELLRHAVAERRRWQEIAALLMRVEKERLWEGHAPSFTAWLKAMARRAELEESVFWRYLKAGRIYAELTGKDVLEVRSAVSAESLELADKIMRVAPEPVAQEVITRTLDGALSRSELRDVWSTYKPAAGGVTARGRLPTDEVKRGEVLRERRAVWEAERERPQNRGEVTRGEIVSAFRSGSWLSAYDQFRADIRPKILPTSVAAVLVVRRNIGGELELHTLTTCVAQPELADAAFEPAPGADFMWLGVPAELTRATLDRAPRMLGILEIGSTRSLRVVREAAQRPKNAQARLDLLSALLQRAYLWP